MESFKKSCSELPGALYCSDELAVEEGAHGAVPRRALGSGRARGPLCGADPAFQCVGGQGQFFQMTGERGRDGGPGVQGTSRSLMGLGRKLT